MCFTFSRQNIWSFHIVVLQKTAKKCTTNYNARAEPLLESILIHLFSNVAVAIGVAAVVS